jgi:hypothetical protein
MNLIYLATGRMKRKMARGVFNLNLGRVRWTFIIFVILMFC